MVGHFEGSPGHHRLVVGQQTVAEVAARYCVHRSWVYRLKPRYDDIGGAAFEPLSRRPHSSPTSIPAATVELIRRLRKELAEAGLHIARKAPREARRAERDSNLVTAGDCDAEAPLERTEAGAMVRSQAWKAVAAESAFIPAFKQLLTVSRRRRSATPPHRSLPYVDTKHRSASPDLLRAHARRHHRDHVIRLVPRP